MSNALAIAAVTEALSSQFEVWLSKSLDGVDAPAGGSTHLAALNPRKFDDRQAVNLFLLQATPNTSGAYHDLLTRSARPAATGEVSFPQVALDLEYLVTFLGDDQQVAQQQMGRVLLGIYESPQLTRSLLAQLAQHSPQVASSRLSEQTEPLRISLVPAGRDELLRIWTAFPQIPYRLSLLLRVSPLILHADMRRKIAKLPTDVSLKVESIRSVGESATAPSGGRGLAQE